MNVRARILLKAADGASDEQIVDALGISRDTADVRVGTVRSCRLPRALVGRTEVREALTEFEPGRSLAYRLEGSAGPFAFASSRWSTLSTTDRTTAVTVEGRLKAKNPAVRILM